MNVYEMFLRDRPSDNERRWRMFEPYECFPVNNNNNSSIVISHGCELDLSISAVMPCQSMALYKNFDAS